MMRICFAVLLSIAAPCLLWAAGTENTPWEISADKISRFQNPETVVAEGNVIIKRPETSFAGTKTLEAIEDAAAAPAKSGVVIYGDWVRYDPQRNVVKARGNVKLISPEEEVRAESAQLDLTRQTGTLTNTRLYFPLRKLYMTGRVVEKTGELTYELTDGWATKCDPDQKGGKPPWSFGWSRASLTVNGFARFVHATFRVKDIPLGYSPYFAFSTNRERKTGFLLPELSHAGRDGAGILVPLFINISPSVDATLYGGYLERRGETAGAEFRYVADYQSMGTFAVNYLNDRKEDTITDDYKSDGIYRTEKNRYWVRGKVNHQFPHDIQAKLDVDLVSDRDYLQEFSDGRTGYTQSDKAFNRTFSRGFEAETDYVRSNTAQVSKTWQRMTLDSEVRIIQDPTEKRSTTHLWSLPMVNFSGRLPLLPRQAGYQSGLQGFLHDIDLVWDSSYVYYWREQDVASQRMDLHPRLTAPLRLSPYLETTATVGLRETMYLVDDNSPVPMGYESGIISRTLYDFVLSTSTIFMRDFTLGPLNNKTLTHIIRPGVSYAYLPAKNQTNLPSLDDIDRLNAQNLITYTLANDFDMRRRDGAGGQTAWKYAFFKATQSYDIREDRRLLGVNDKSRPFSDIFFEAMLAPQPEWKLTYESNLDVYGRGFLRYQLASVYSMPEGAHLFLGYDYEKDKAVEQLRFAASLSLLEKISLQASLSHSFYDDKLSDASLSLLYEPDCWSLEMIASTTADDDYRFNLIFSLEGIGKFIGMSQTLYAQ